MAIKSIWLVYFRVGFVSSQGNPQNGSGICGWAWDTSIPWNHHPKESCFGLPVANLVRIPQESVPEVQLLFEAIPINRALVV